MTERLSWLNALLRLQEYSRNDEHPFWLLENSAKIRLEQAIQQERKTLVTREMGS
jgi:hypothetical protein